MKWLIGVVGVRIEGDQCLDISTSALNPRFPEKANGLIIGSLFLTAPSSSLISDSNSNPFTNLSAFYFLFDFHYRHHSGIAGELVKGALSVAASAYKALFAGDANVVQVYIFQYSLNHLCFCTIHYVHDSKINGTIMLIMTLHWQLK